MGLNPAAKNGGSMLAKFAILGSEGGEKVAVNVEFADNFALHENRHDNLRLRFDRTGEVARVGADVVHHDSLAGGGGGSTDTLVQRDASMRCHRAPKRAEDKDVFLSFFFQHVEANPVVFEQISMQQLDDPLHQFFLRSCFCSKSIELWAEYLRFRIRCRHE